MIKAFDILFDKLINISDIIFAHTALAVTRFDIFRLQAVQVPLQLDLGGVGLAAIRLQ